MFRRNIRPETRERQIAAAVKRGGKCECCVEDNKNFLYVSRKYGVTCFNCAHAKRYYGSCPHERGKSNAATDTSVQP